ncbi:hypothetical protein L1049_002130 [Liquidambar formosana]|uniref:Uncharacterized protein n=1 Tax=Liquidambar formosana TaxID=63359 RepID=A0AAP0R6E8_LIQFO
MSEQAIIYLGSIGLLGEYCPSSRKKNRSLLERIDCMPLEPFQENSEFHGCSWMQPVLTSEDQPSCVQEALEDNIGAAYILNSGIWSL